MHLRRMNRSRPPYLRLVPTGWSGQSHVTTESEARRDASHWYIRLREEETDAEAWAQFDEWLQTDPLHREAWASMCETMEAVERAPSRPRRNSRPGRLRRPNAFGHSRSVSNSRKPRRRVAAAAAVAACAIALAFPVVSMRLRADHITSAGQVEQFLLIDGSTIRLGPDSAVAVDYDSSARKIRLLRGQALFDVSHDPAKPFRVVAGDVTTTVLGTRFDVRMIGDTTSVAVQRGHVRVEDSGDEPHHSRDLRVGQWVRVDSRHVTQAGAIAPSLVGSWSSGQALADNRSIASVIEEVRPWYNGRIIVLDSALASRLVTGIYNLREPAQALAMIVRPYGGRVRQVTPWILVVSGSD